MYLLLTVEKVLLFISSAKIRASSSTCSRPSSALCPRCSRAPCFTSSRESRALVYYVPRTLRTFVLYVSRTLRALVQHVFRALCALLGTLVPNVSYVLRFPVLLCASCRTCSFAPHPTLASGVSSLTYSYASHVS